MGMYTELDIKVNLCKNLREDIRVWLDYQANIVDILLFNGEELVEYENIPPELKDTRVDWLRWNDDYILIFEECNDKSYYLHTKFSIKNYNDELELLIDTLQPYILNRGNIGTMWYEEDDEPKVVYIHDN